MLSHPLEDHWELGGRLTMGMEAESALHVSLQKQNGCFDKGFVTKVM